MIDVDVIRQKIDSPESPILEFKRQWYWNGKNDNLQDAWGEFIKDIISLGNAYINYCGEDRYLIIGYDEGTNKKYNIDINKIYKLSNLNIFNKHFVKKLCKVVSPTIENIEVALMDLDGYDLLIFKIPSPVYMLELISELKTKTRHLDQGDVLVRKGKKGDSVKTATTQERKILEIQFKDYLSFSSVQENINQISDDIQITIENTVQLYINKNSSYSYDEGYPKSFKNLSEKIYFEVYKISEQLGGQKEFLYIHENSNQSKTYGILKKEKLINDYESLIILTERPTKVNEVKRKENIKNTFKASNVFFIDEFGYEFLYKDCFFEYQKFNLPIYVESLCADTEGETTALEKLEQWYRFDSLPLVVIKGYGGIGKTTIAKQFLDSVYENNKKSGLLFIDSNEIIDELARATSSTKKINDIYEFYVAQINAENYRNTTFTKDLFRLSLDNGSLIVVLDGLDEVIAKLGPRFDINSFINSIVKECTSSLQKAKILITCRDSFWDSIDSDIDIPEINLIPFNRKLTEDFFSQAFNQNQSKIKKALLFSEKFAIEEKETEEPTYIPYALDVIKYIVNSDGNITSFDFMSSTYLCEKITNDFIIGNLCNREIKKLENLGVDSQIKFFIEMSIYENSIIPIYDIKAKLEEIIGIDKVTTSLIEAFQSHPLLYKNGTQLSFRYDFFASYFKLLLVSKTLSDRNINVIYESSNIFNILSENVKYLNGFSKSLCERLVYDDDLKIFCMEIIEYCQSNIEQNETIFDESILKNTISSIFSLLLTFIDKSRIINSNIESRTALMHEIFYDDGEDNIKNMYIINLLGQDKSKPILDFRSTNFNNCHFEQYEFFWNCPIDEKTRFYYSFFDLLEPIYDDDVKFYQETFGMGCDKSNIQKILDQKNSEIDEFSDNLKEEIVKILRLFYQRGNFYPQKQNRIRAKVFAMKRLPTLLNNGVIKINHKSKINTTEYIISEEYRGLINYIEQGGASELLEKIVNLFIETR